MLWREVFGAAGWIKRELWDGINTHGSTVARYTLSIDTTPEVLITKKKRKALYDKHANPDIRRSEKAKRAAVARYWGGWEEGSGLRQGSAACAQQRL